MDTLTPELGRPLNRPAILPFIDGFGDASSLLLVGAEALSGCLDDEDGASRRRFRDSKKNAKALLMEDACPPGEIDLADFEEMEPHPIVVVSREDLNRSNWVAAVLITSKWFEERSKGRKRGHHWEGERGHH